MKAKRRTTRYAGRVDDQDYGVVTSYPDRSPAHNHCKRPCASCPWRLDSPVGAFPAEAFRLSAKTAYDMADTVFACHMTGVDNPKTCAGFLLRGAAHNLQIRLAQLTKGLDLSAIDAGEVELYESYRDMAEANGVEPDDPALARCR